MALVTITNRQARIMWDVFSRITGRSMHRKAAFAIAKNKSKLEHIIKALDEARTPPEEFLELERKRFEIIKDYASKDKAGNPKIVRGVEYQIPAKKRDEFNEKVEKLRKEYAGAVEKAAEVEQQYKEILDETVEINLHIISEDYLPEEMSPAEIAGLEPFILWNDSVEETTPKDKKFKVVE